MKIKKFEAKKYSDSKITNLTREQFIKELMDIFTDQEIFGYEIIGTQYSPKTEELLLICEPTNGNDEKVIKLDLSDLGIEIGTTYWYDDNVDEFDSFVPEVNLDTDVTKQVKNFRKSLGKYNL